MNNTSLGHNLQKTEFENSTLAPVIMPHKPPENLLVTDIIGGYINTAIVTVGILLNSLVVLLMRQPALRCKVIALYFTVLAVCDSLFLLVSFLVICLPRLAGFEIIMISNVTCAIMRFLVDVSHLLSNAILCALSVSRAIVICYPFCRKKVDSFFRTKLAFSATGITIILLSSYTLWLDKITEMDGNKVCMASDKYFELNIRMWLNSILFIYLPVFVLVLCNIIIGVQLRKTNRNRDQLSCAIFRNKNRVHVQFVITAVVVCSVHIGLTITMTLLGQLSHLMSFHAMWISRDVAITLGLASHSCNLFLYICSNKQLLSELKKMFNKLCCRRGGNPPTVRHSFNISVVSSTNI